MLYGQVVIPECSYWASFFQIQYVLDSRLRGNDGGETNVIRHCASKRVFNLVPMRRMGTQSGCAASSSDPRYERFCLPVYHGLATACNAGRDGFPYGAWEPWQTPKAPFDKLRVNGILRVS